MTKDKETSVYWLLHQIIHLSKYQEVKKMEALGLKPGQAGILFMLNCYGKLSQKELAQKMGITPPSMTVALRKMEEKGLIVKEADTEDQRIIRIQISEEGKACIEEIKQVMNDMEQLLYGDMQQEERLLFRRMLLETRDSLLNYKEFQGLDMHSIMEKTKPKIKGDF